MEVQDYENLDDTGLPLALTVKLDPEKDFQENAKLCFKQDGTVSVRAVRARAKPVRPGR